MVELAVCYHLTGQFERGLEALARAQTVFAERGDKQETACLAKQGTIYRLQGRQELALETYASALSKGPIGNVWTRQEIYAGRGHIHLARGQFDQAEQAYRQAIAQFQKDGEGLEVNLVGGVYLGDLYLAQGCATDALDAYGRCLEEARPRGLSSHECLALLGMAQACYMRNEPDQVDALARRIIELARDLHYHNWLADIHLLQGHVVLDDSLADQEHVIAAVDLYGASLKYSLLYNRYKLDSSLQTIIDHCQGQEDRGERVLRTIQDAWRTDTDGQGVPLIKAERVAREREPGDGLPQLTVLERIEQALP